MLCSISGTVPEEPVISKKSGLLFEKRLIEKVVQDTERCPVTDEPLDQDDIIPVKTSQAIKPRTTAATSIPAILSLFQNEWDSTMLETHKLRQALHSSRQELSHALYQHDAATRVIARLIKERDQLRSQLESVQRSAAPAAGGSKRPAAAAAAAAANEDVEMEEPSGKKAKGGLTSAVTEKLTACSNELSKGRKKRVISESVATPDDIAAFSLLQSQPLHSAKKGGILALDVSPGSDNVIATAGVDGAVQVFDRSAQRVLTTLKGHTKKVNDVAFVGSQDLIASASLDKTVRIWKSTTSDHTQYECASILSEQDGDVVAVCVHPTNDYIVTAAGDGSWAFYDIAAAECLARVTPADSNAALSCAALHPDGLILGTGNDAAAVKIWETRTQKCVADFAGHAGCVSSMSFSENGYYLATAATDGVKLWDLRKLKNFKTLEPYQGVKNGGTTAVSFDYSGLFLGVGGPDARVYGVKQDWEVVKEFKEVPKKGVYSLKFGTDAKALFVGASDHNLRVFG